MVKLLSSKQPSTAPSQVWWTGSGACCTRQLVRCRRHKSEWAIGGQPTRPWVHLVNHLRRSARWCRCRHGLVYQADCGLARSPVYQFVILYRLCLRTRRSLTTNESIPGRRSKCKLSRQLSRRPDLD